jgi:hypothetical protein
MKSASVRLVGAVLVVTAGIVLAQNKQDRKPLGEAPTLVFSAPKMTQLARKQFLDSDFTIVRDVGHLPRPVLGKFTEQNGSRPVIANPGENFIVGDAIYDSSVPGERLIFAGVSGERCFVHYEKGGRAHSYLVVLFDLTPTDAKPLWQGYCSGPAANISNLLSDCR